MVEHDLRVGPREANQGDDETGVTELSTSKEEFVNRYRFFASDALPDLMVLDDGVLHAGLLLLAPPAEDAVVGVEVGVRRFRVDPELSVLDVLFVSDAHRRLERLARLEIRLAVEVLRLDEANAVRVRSRENHDVGGDLIVFLEEDDVPNLQLLPQRPLPFRRTGGRVVVGNDVREGFARDVRLGEGGRDAAAAGLGGFEGAGTEEAGWVGGAVVGAERVKGEGRVGLDHRVATAQGLAGLGGEGLVGVEEAGVVGTLLLAELADASRELVVRIRGPPERPPRPDVVGRVDVVPVAETSNGRVVDLVVKRVSSKIFEAVLEARDDENRKEGEHGDLW